MDRELKDKYVRESKGFIFLTEEVNGFGKRYISNIQIDLFSVGWVERNGVQEYWGICWRDSSIFYAYCKANDQDHFLRMLDKIKINHNLKMKILYP